MLAEGFYTQCFYIVNNVDTHPPPKCIFFLDLSSELQPVLTAYLTFLLLRLRNWTCNFLSHLWISRTSLRSICVYHPFISASQKLGNLLWCPLFSCIFSPSAGVCGFCHWNISWVYFSIFDCYLSSLNYHLLLRLDPHVNTCSVLTPFLHNLTRLSIMYI